MMEIGFLILCNLLFATFWTWICFLGGDQKWCNQIKVFWRGGAYTWLKPWHCKAFSTVFMLGIIAGDIGIILSKLK